MSPLFIRIILCPGIFLWGLFMLFAGTFLFFPLGVLVLVSLLCLVANPVIWLLKKGNTKIEYFEPFINDFNHNTLGHVLGATIHFWLPFYVVYVYLKTGIIYTVK